MANINPIGSPKGKNREWERSNIQGHKDGAFSKTGERDDPSDSII